jgi:1-acyl-sn-glycerol-3-phosphate acyltransferase
MQGENLFKFSVKTSLFLIVTLVLSPFYFLILLTCYRWREQIGPKLVQFYSKIYLIIFRVHIEEVRNYEIIKKMRKGILIISNHTSFLDIFVLSSIFGSVFVSKAEVKYYPVIGQIAYLMGSVFLNRNSSKERLKLIKTIANACSDRILVVFPQGTTSRVTEQLPFKRGIFKVIELNPEISILPVSLHYREDAEIAWHKPQSFRENAMRVSAQDSIHVKVIVHNPVSIDDYREKTSAEVCRMVEQIVLEPLGICCISK